MTSAASDLAFLAPGFVHQLGNLFFGMQAQVLQADAGAAGPALQALAGAIDRGTGALRLLRHALGDGGPEPAPAGRALAELADLLRIALREAGHRLEATGLDAGERSVDLAGFVPAVLAAVRALVDGVPTGMAATIQLAWDDATSSLRLAAVPAAGSLPFPVALAAALGRWSERARAAGWPWRLDRDGGGMRLAPVR